ncbi:uracil-DNA glycosylase [Coraliomargarita sinensis]|uniref:Type-4 uracil-DNA glycosylase n=1 Tax=Coraliomargarita sinensis TaxID=2174842 RepID=A0A317ZEJ0_9BACT|nr:uracil-DNA glycosylase [Coraliomargarita sinensis]PXA03855.1 uracil-DNA glycosylase [Coraliomargarita sinensis]
MSDALIAINEELRRLQQEGVDRVFVEESTLSLLQPVAAKERTAPKKETTAGPISELEELAKGKEVKKKATPPKATSVSRPTGKPLPEQAPEFEIPEGDAATQIAWLKERVENCPTCKEHLSEHGKVVFGTGSAEADIFFCGEAPGADEEVQGEPFVGKAGQLLTKIIAAMGLQRENVYIANILKWRPEHDKPYGNRPPTVEEMNFCLPYVRAQIEIVKPKVIVALGNTAVTGLLGPDPNRRMGSIRGTWQEFAGIPLMITFHPSYLLRAESQNNPNAKKRLVWEDMLKVMEKVDLPISEKQQGFFLPKEK